MMINNITKLKGYRRWVNYVISVDILGVKVQKLTKKYYKNILKRMHNEYKPTRKDFVKEPELLVLWALIFIRANRELFNEENQIIKSREEVLRWLANSMYRYLSPNYKLFKLLLLTGITLRVVNELLFEIKLMYIRAKEIDKDVVLDLLMDEINRRFQTLKASSSLHLDIIEDLIVNQKQMDLYRKEDWILSFSMFESNKEAWRKYFKEHPEEFKPYMEGFEKEDSKTFDKSFREDWLIRYPKTPYVLLILSNVLACKARDNGLTYENIQCIKYLPSKIKKKII